MTIALGMVCHKGVIVAADTKIASGTAAQKASKLYTFKGKSGAFAIAFASEDANATRTLINRIERKLSNEDCPNTVRLEDLISGEMTAWRSAYTVNPPAMQLVVSSRLQNDGARLYLCEPPSTFIQYHDYVGAGTGASVTDSLNTALFGLTHDATEIQTALRRVAYLMYRAKKDDVFCGKSTYCAVVSWNCDEPIIVNHLDFESAEKSAQGLDFLLHSTSTLYLSGGDAKTIKINAQGIASMFEGMTSFRNSEFHDTYGQVITL